MTPSPETGSDRKRYLVAFLVALVATVPLSFILGALNVTFWWRVLACWPFAGGVCWFVFYNWPLRSSGEAS